MPRSIEEKQRKIERSERKSKKSLYHNDMEIFRIFPKFA